MAIQKKNYLELPPKVREASGAVALSDLRRMLNVPGISAEQRAEIEVRIKTVTAWIKGTLPTDPLPPPKVAAKAPAGKHHTVVASEKVAVKEDVR
jgi:hypothetical protein